MTDITLWMPITEPHALAVLGKMGEELNELAGRLCRTTVQGVDGIDPKSGLTNREEIVNEISDALATIDFIGEWHELISKELGK